MANERMKMPKRAGILKRAGSFCNENVPRLGTFGSVSKRQIMRTKANIPIQRKVMRHPICRPMILPIGNPKIMATDVPVTIMLNAVDLYFPVRFLRPVAKRWTRIWSAYTLRQFLTASACDSWWIPPTAAEILQRKNDTGEEFFHLESGYYNHKR